jgi:hypothetical protein
MRPTRPAAALAGVGQQWLEMERVHNHLCPSDQAFSEISVGQELHLLGQVSPYGIAAESMRWSRPSVKAKP